MIDKVSVAMCTHNGEAYLLQQLNSIFDQSRIPDELIICDDFSVDGTREILEEYRCRYPHNIRLVYNQKNLGFVKNFEQAISRCSGDAIFLCDQDDIWVPDRVERSIAIFNEYPGCGYIFSDATLIDEEGRKLLQSLWVRIGFTHKQQQSFVEPGNQPDLLYPKNVVTGATMAFRAKCRKMFLPIPELNTVIHDGWIAIILSLNGRFGVALNEPLIYYRIHPQQQLGAPRRSILRGFTKRFVDHRARIKREISDLSADQLRIEVSGNAAAMKRFERTLGRLIGHLESRQRSLGLKSRLRRVIPTLKLYQKGGYERYPSPYLYAFKDIVY